MYRSFDGMEHWDVLRNCDGQGATHCVNGDVLEGNHQRQHHNRVLERLRLVVTPQTARIHREAREWVSSCRAPSGVNANFGFSSFSATDGTTCTELYALGHTLQSDCDAGNERGLYGKL